MSRRIVIRLTVVICIAVVLVVALGYAPVVFLWSSTQQLASKDAPLRLSPVPLRTTATAPANSKSVSAFGIEFCPPWPPSETKLSRFVAIFVFGGDYGIALFNPKGIDFVTSLRRGGPPYQPFGPDALKSNYELAASVYRTTPAQMSIWGSRERLVGTCIRLRLKDVEKKLFQTGLFEFQFNRLKGFQLGDPEHTDRVMLRGFDPRDQEIRLIVSVQRGSSARIRQEDLNLILSSLHLVDNAKSLETVAK